MGDFKWCSWFCFQFVCLGERGFVFRMALILVFVVQNKAGFFVIAAKLEFFNFQLLPSTLMYIILDGNNETIKKLAL